MPIDFRSTQLRLVQEGELPSQPPVFDLLAKVCSEDVVDNQEQLRAVLNDIFRELSLADTSLIGMLTELEEAGHISRDDRMYLFVLFVVAQHHNQETLMFLRDEIVYRRLHAAGLTQLLDTLNLPPALQKYLRTGLGRCAFYFDQQL